MMFFLVLILSTTSLFSASSKKMLPSQQAAVSAFLQQQVEAKARAKAGIVLPKNSSLEYAVKISTPKQRNDLFFDDEANASINNAARYVRSNKSVLIQGLPGSGLSTVATHVLNASGRNVHVMEINSFPLPSSYINDRNALFREISAKAKEIGCVILLDKLELSTPPREYADEQQKSVIKFLLELEGHVYSINRIFSSEQRAAGLGVCFVGTSYDISRIDREVKGRLFKDATTAIIDLKSPSANIIEKFIKNKLRVSALPSKLMKYTIGFRMKDLATLSAYARNSIVPGQKTLSFSQNFEPGIKAVMLNKAREIESFLSAAGFEKGSFSVLPYFDKTLAEGVDLNGLKSAWGDYYERNDRGEKFGPRQNAYQQFEDFLNRCKKIVSAQLSGNGKSLGGPAPSLILYGPPGTGKTVASRVVVQMLGCNSMYVYVAAGTIKGRFVGESAAKLGALFTAAKMAAPCLLAFDEADGVFSPVSEGGDKQLQAEMRSVALVEINKVTERVTPDCFRVIMAMTNYYSAIDSATAQRFTTKFPVLPANSEGRIEQFSSFFRERSGSINTARYAFFNDSEFKNIFEFMAVREGVRYIVPSYRALRGVKGGVDKIRNRACSLSDLKNVLRQQGFLIGDAARRALEAVEQSLDPLDIKLKRDLFVAYEEPRNRASVPRAERSSRLPRYQNGGAYPRRDAEATRMAAHSIGLELQKLLDAVRLERVA